MPTRCPDFEVMPTECPDGQQVSTECPDGTVLPTICPGTWTECAENPTECWPEETTCVQIPTECPCSRSTYCPSYADKCYFGPDVNGDGCVNVADLLIVRNRMGWTCFPDDPTKCPAITPGK